MFVYLLIDDSFEISNLFLFRLEAPLGDVLCNCGEIDTWKSWNSMIKRCEIVGEPHKYGLDFCLHFGAWLTFSAANRVYRYIDPKNGFVLEFASKKKFPGVKQDGVVVNLSSYQMFIPTTNAQGKNCTLAIQIVSVPLPHGVPVPNWLNQNSNIRKRFSEITFQRTGSKILNKIEIVTLHVPRTIFTVLGF
jgi:hypothetical protein